MAHSFPVQFSMQLHPLQRSVFWDWSKRNISFSTASSSATSEHGNHVTKENMSFFLIQTQSRNIIRAKWGLWWDGVISINEVQKREQRDCLECLWIQFSLLPGPRWLVLHPWLYHCQHRLEGVSSQGSAFQVCCFLSPRNWLYVSALGPQKHLILPHQHVYSQDLCLCLHKGVRTWVTSSAETLGRAIPSLSLSSRA